jgi:hypothetical protein
MEVPGCDHEDGEQWHGDLPPRGGAMGVREHPDAVSVPSVCSKPFAQLQCPAYPIIASTSIGATVAACSQENQPKDIPARPPKA